MKTIYEPTPRRLQQNPGIPSSETTVKIGAKLYECDCAATSAQHRRSCTIAAKVRDLHTAVAREFGWNGSTFTTRAGTDWALAIETFLREHPEF